MPTLRLPTLVFLVFTLPSLAQTNLLQNPSFEQGDQSPVAWKLSAPPGAWETGGGHLGPRCVSVTGEAPAQNNWWSQAVAVEPLTTYRFSFWARTSAGASGGCIISGPDSANRDTDAGQDWERHGHVFVTGPEQKQVTLRLGHWYKTGTVYFGDADLHPVLPVHHIRGALVLGAGEEVEGKQYTFYAPLGGEGSNYARPLAAFSAGFNSNRWVFGPGASVVYRHEIGGVAQTAVTVRPTIGWYGSGSCLVEASADGTAWTRLGKLDSLTTGAFALPAALLPAKSLLIRLRSPHDPEGDAQPGSFQIYGYSYEATLAQALPNLTGDTRYLDIGTTDTRLAVAVEDLGDLLPGRHDAVRLRLHNKSADVLDATVGLGIVLGGSTAVPTAPQRTWQVALPAGEEKPLDLPYTLTDAGEYHLLLTVGATGQTRFVANMNFTVPSLYAANYGHALASDAASDLWWCEGTYKVSRERPPVVAAATDRLGPVWLSAASNEFEPVQLVVRPNRDLTNFTAQVSDLTGPGGARIPAQNTTVCQVWYHYVKHPTDEAGCVGWWPDALPPLDRPISLPANQNQPLWVTLKVPKATPPGDYAATVSLAAAGWSATVPLRLHVWGFELPDDSHVASAFGFDAGSVFRYNNITDPADQDRVWDLYMQNFRDHRIAPYTFWRKGIQVNLTGTNWQGGDIVEDNPASGKRCLRIVDDSDTAVTQADYASRLQIDPAARYILTFSARTKAPGQQYQVTFNSFDSSGAWISGHNLDVSFTGDTQWKRETLSFIPQERSPNARSLTLTLRPVLWTPDGRLTGTAWFDDISLVKAGTTENLIQGGDFEAGTNNVQIKVDFTDWDKEADKYLNQYHFSAFQLPVQGMGGGTFYSRQSGQLGPFKQGTPDYRRLMKEYLTQVQDHLQQKGWLDKAFIYWFDEPEAKDYAFVKEGMDELKLAAPRLRRMLTVQPVEPLFGSVDIWCPVLPNHNPDICAARQKLGDHVWWYVCTGPKAPWPGLFIDHSAVDLRTWLWMTWKWNVEAVLVWNTTWWTSSAAFPDEPQNPWDDPMGYCDGYGLKPGTVSFWGNGDGRFLYPANKDVHGDHTVHVAGPVNSIRWEMLRDGIEDFEYFARLKELVAKRGPCPEQALLQVPAEIVKNQTAFSHDPQLLYAHREKLARAIESLTR